MADIKTLPLKKTARISPVIMITTLLRYDHQIEVIPSQDLHFRSPHQSTGSCHQNQQCQLWAETSSIKTKLPCSETFHLRFDLVYRHLNGVPYLISTKDEWSSVSMPGTLSRAEQTRSHSNFKNKVTSSWGSG